MNGAAVLFNGVQVGVTGTAFTYTFVSHVVTKTVTGVDSKPHQIRLKAGPDINVVVHLAGYQDFDIPALFPPPS